VTNGRREFATASRFALVGLLATAVHLAVAAAVLALAPQSSEFAATLIAFLIAFYVSLIGHRRYTFGHAGDARKFFLVAAGGFALNNSLLGGLLGATALDGFAAVAIATLAVPVLTYAGSRLWVFRQIA
jgi:putative flippase GtrA